MSNSNSWENEPLESHLASWRACPPSARLRTDLFGATAEDAALENLAGLWAGWRWLAPALVCSFMALVALSPRNDRLERLTGSKTNRFFSDTARDQKYAAYLMVGFHSDQNGPLRETLEWTFAPYSNSTVGSLPAVATNNLLH